MKNLVLVLALIGLGTACATRMPDGPRAAPEGARNPVVLVRAGELDEALLQRLRNWGQDQLAIAVPLAESLEVPDGASLEAVAEAASQRLAPEDLGAVVLYVAKGDVRHHGVLQPEHRVVVVNVNTMREGADDEKLARRLERQVIRGIGLLMGLDLSPNPHSAMADYQSLEELDAIGRNLDPPWQLKLQERARDLGLSVDPDNPYYMLPR